MRWSQREAKIKKPNTNLSFDFSFLVFCIVIKKGDPAAAL